MKSTSGALWLLIAIAAVACIGAAIAGGPVRWLALAVAAGLLAVLAALRLLSQRLWQMAAELTDASNRTTRSSVCELHSMHVVLGRFPECSLPTTSYSMTFGNLHAILELLDELQPETVVEFGSGLSTIMVAAWFKRRGRGRLHSFDHDSAWATKTSQHLARHGLDSYTALSCVPLVPTSVHGHTVDWYQMKADVLDFTNIDLVIVDGPPSHEQPMARLPALFALESRLSETCCIALDDAARPREREVAAIWRAHVPSMEAYTLPGQTGLAIFRRGARTHGQSPSLPSREGMPREAMSQESLTADCDG